MAHRRSLVPLARLAIVGILLAGCAAEVRAATVGPADDASAAGGRFTCEVMGSMSPAAPEESAPDESTPDD